MRSRRALPILFAVALASLPVRNLGAQQTLTDDVASDPRDAEFVFDDVRHFLEAMEAMASERDSAATLQRLYLDRASPGLRLFIEKYDLTTDRMLAAMREHPESYRRIPRTLSTLEAAVPVFRRTYADIKDAIPSAVFPPTYFVTAGHRGIGSGSVAGPLLSIEKEDPARIEETLPSTLVHEMIHMQQLAALGPDYFVIFSGPERTLLATSIREGVATFFSELITGGSEFKNEARAFLLANEVRLWRQFESEMLGTEMGDWLWTTPADPSQPQDVGYAMGARIAEAYYDRGDDKGKAAAEILSVTDYPAFLAESGYADRMAGRP